MKEVMQQDFNTGVDYFVWAKRRGWKLAHGALADPEKAKDFAQKIKAEEGVDVRITRREVSLIDIA